MRKNRGIAVQERLEQPAEAEVKAVEAVDVRKEYKLGESIVRAVRGISLSVGQGEFVCITGKSGSGKSTLLNLLAGLERPTGGEVALLGEHIEKMGENQRNRLRGRHVGFVFQSYNLLPQFTALENVAVPLALRGMRQKERNRLAMEMLELVGLKDHAKHRPTEMSGGQQQRAGIARAIITKPAIVFADEPTGNLDTATGAEVMELLTGIFRERGTTFLLVSHDPDMKRYMDREIRMEDGEILSENSSK